MFADTLDEINNNWQERSVSEKRIIGSVAVLMVCALFYLFIADPLVNWREQEQRRLKANERTLVIVTDLAARFNSQKAGTGNAEGLAGIIDSSLQEYGLTMAGFQPGKKGDARLRLSNVAYEPVMQWLYSLEYQHNIAIEELSMAKDKKSSALNINIRVRKN